MKEGITIEVCCGCAGDVVAAYRAGADRVELNASLAAGGLTPSLGELVTAKKHADIPIICMVRPRAGGFCYTDDEFEVMMCDAQLLLDNGADGLAFGFLYADGSLDVERTGIMARLCTERGKQAVYHRAFDVCTSEPLETARTLAGLGVTRLLTSGREATASAGAALIKKLTSLSGAPEILAGGGVRPENTGELVRSSGVCQLHFSCHKTEIDPSATHNPPLCFNIISLPRADARSIIDEHRLLETVGFIRNFAVGQDKQK